MDAPHPAAALLYVASLSVLLAAPVVAWSLLGERKEASARWWFGGCLLYALAALVFLLRFMLPESVRLLLAEALVIGCLLMLGESLRRELGDPPRQGLSRIVLGGLAWLACLALSELGLRNAVGADLELLIYTLLEGSLLGQIQRLRKRQPSRGLLIVAAGLSLVMALNLVRIVVSQSSGEPVRVLSYTALGNAAYVANFLTIVMASFGFLGYMLERAKRRELEQAEARSRAEVQEAAQRQRADELAEVVRQRDEMLLMNSRFSALSSLAAFNASLVHEISQPLQALSAVIEGHELDLERQGAAPPAAIVHAKEQLQRMSAVLATLRNLIASQRPVLERLGWLHTVQEILPVLRSEAQARHITLSLTHQAQVASVEVDASRVMLQRVIFNLATNAFEALGSMPPVPERSEGKVDIELDVCRIHGADHAVLRVRDNGPGLPQEMVGQRFEPFHTAREGGTGMGLALARLLLESWGGYVQANNSPQGGACVEVGLPVKAER